MICFCFFKCNCYSVMFSCQCQLEQDAAEAARGEYGTSASEKQCGAGDLHPARLHMNRCMQKPSRGTAELWKSGGFSFSFGGLAVKRHF